MLNLIYRVRDWIQHRFNPLHIYCRLRHEGYSQNEAIKLACRWDRVYSYFFPKKSN